MFSAKSNDNIINLDRPAYKTEGNFEPFYLYHSDTTDEKSGNL